MCLKPDVLLISDDLNWLEMVKRGAQELVNLDIVQAKEEALARIKERKGGPAYAGIIIDRTAVAQDMPGFIRQIRVEQPEAQIIVTATVPSWRDARDVLLAGAANYVRRPWDKASIQTMLKELVNISDP